jgi:hypothetical protein
VLTQVLKRLQGDNDRDVRYFASLCPSSTDTEEECNHKMDKQFSLAVHANTGLKMVNIFYHILYFLLYICFYYQLLRACDGTVGRGTALQAGSSQVQFPMVSLEFFIDIILPVALWPWASQPVTEMITRKYFLGGESGWCVGLRILPPSCADCLEIWEPQPCGALMACNGLLYLITNYCTTTLYTLTCFG